MFGREIFDGDGRYQEQLGRPFDIPVSWRSRREVKGAQPLAISSYCASERGEPNLALVKCDIREDDAGGWRGVSATRASC